MDKFTIHCKICGDDVELTQLNDFDYFCDGCGSVYTNEDGVLNHAVMEYYRAEYLGAKRAGLIKDSEGEYL